MKLLVTGGAGFIGSNFIRYWLKKYPKDKIINLDKLTYAGNLENLRDVGNNPNYKFVKGDICDGKLIDKIMKDVDVVCHMAAESHVDRSILGPQVFIKTNVLGTQVLLDAAVRHGGKRFHHVSCYDQKTRALTKKGLKYYWELSPNDEILALDLKTKKIKWGKIKRIIIQDYKGPMLRIKSDRIDFLVTPNHRMLLQTPRAGRLVFKEAENLGSRNFLPRGAWMSKVKGNRDFMYFLGFFIGDGFLAYQEKVEPNLTGLSKRQYLTLARDKKTGRFVSVGHIGPERKRISYSYRIFLDVPEDDKSRRKIEKTLTKLGVAWHSQHGAAGEHLYLTSQKLFKILKDCGRGACQKQIPRWALEVDYEGLRALFDGLIDSDGHRTHNRITFSSSSQRLAENFAELCIKLGLTPHIFIRKSHPARYNGRIIQGRDNYLITVAKTRRSIIPGYGLNHIQKVRYRGKIWCVKVPENKNLLVERNGIFAFCGNTDEVFGALPLETKEKFNENSPFRPNSPYAASKAASDLLVRAYFKTYGLPVTITNTSNNYGPYQFPEKLIPLAITNLLEGKKVPIYGDGLYVRDWLYVEDHCWAIDLVLHSNKVGETYCVGGMTRDISNLDLIKKICRIMKKNFADSVEFVKDRPGHDRRYAVDWKKIKNKLGWRPRHNFDIWLEKTINWYKKNEQWWRLLKV